MKTLRLLMTVLPILFIAWSGEAQAQQRLQFTGLAVENQGLRAFNRFGPPPAQIGHALNPLVCGCTNAYYFIETRPNIGVHGTAIVSGFAPLQAALQKTGKTMAQIKIRVPPMSLGLDRNGQEWRVEGQRETRTYRGVYPHAGFYTVSLDNEAIMLGATPDMTLTIDNGVLPQDHRDDRLSAVSLYSMPAKKDWPLSIAGNAIADAILASLGNFGWRLNFTDIQPSIGQFQYQEPAGQPRVEPPVYPPVRVDGAYFNCPTVLVETSYPATTVKAAITALTQPACGQRNGSLTLQITNGRPPFTVWSEGGIIREVQFPERQRVFADLPARDQYQILVRDALGNTAGVEKRFPPLPCPK